MISFFPCLLQRKLRAHELNEVVELFTMNNNENIQVPSDHENYRRLNRELQGSSGSLFFS